MNLIGPMTVKEPVPKEEKVCANKYLIFNDFTIPYLVPHVMVLAFFLFCPLAVKINFCWMLLQKIFLSN